MNICNNHITFHVTRDIRNEAMKKIEKLPLKYIDGHSYGDVVSRVIADVDQFADGLLMGFTQFFTGVVTILGTLGFIFSIHVTYHSQLQNVLRLSFHSQMLLQPFLLQSFPQSMLSALLLYMQAWH